MKRWTSSHSPKLSLGTLAHGFPLLPRKLVLKPPEIATHKHVIGVSGVGKSKFLEAFFLQLVRRGIGVSFIDPHGDSAEALLSTFIASGFFERPGAPDRLLYIEFSESGPYLPFNVLKQPRLGSHTLASNVLEAFHRAWPALSDGAAPQFDNLVLAGSLVLIENQLPLPALHHLLTNADFRESLLAQVSDEDTVGFFRDRFDHWNKQEAPQMIESTLRRLFLLTFSPILKYSLSQAENALDFRALMDQSQAVIYNLGRIQDQDARRLLGCLLTIGYETAALSRGPTDSRSQHHLLLDEFSDYSAQSEEALSRMLSQTRKFGLYSTMAHQTWSQASERLQGALQNVGVKVALRVGRADAEILAKSLGVVDPLEIKSEALTERSQPVFMELGSQWEGWIQKLSNLKARHALVKVGTRPTVEIQTLPVPSLKVSRAALDAMKRSYGERLMVPRDRIQFPSRKTLPKRSRSVEA